MTKIQIYKHIKNILKTSIFNKSTLKTKTDNRQILPLHHVVDVQVSLFDHIVDSFSPKRLHAASEVFLGHMTGYHTDERRKSKRKNNTGEDKSKHESKLYSGQR